MAIDLSNLKISFGSLIVDAALVLAIIWWGATMTERLDAISKRMDDVEQPTQEDTDEIAYVVQAIAKIRQRLEGLNQ